MDSSVLLIAGLGIVALSHLKKRALQTAGAVTDVLLDPTPVTGWKIGWNALMENTDIDESVNDALQTVGATVHDYLRNPFQSFMRAEEALGDLAHRALDQVDLSVEAGVDQGFIEAYDEDYWRHLEEGFVITEVTPETGDDLTFKDFAFGSWNVATPVGRYSDIYSGMYG
jgi:hypothetical protein